MSQPQPKGHFWLNDMLKHVALLFSELKTPSKMMCTKGTFMLIFTSFVFVISSQSTSGKRDFERYPSHRVK